MDEIDNKAHKADTSSDDLAPAENAVVAAEADAEADAKPKAKSIRSKAKKADATSDDLTQAENDAVAAEADAKADSKPKAKAKSTRSKAKKADATSEDLAQDENAAVAAETDTKANAKPKAKSTRSKAKKADTSSEDLAQSENAVVASETAAKDDAKPKAKSTRSKAKKADTSIADGGHEYVLVDATDYDEDEDFFSVDTTADVQVYSNKRDVLQAIKNSLKAHRAAFDNAHDQNEKSMISRRLQIINEFLNKGIILARGFHVSKAKFELFAEKIESLFLNTLYQGMKYQDVRALTEIMLLFLQYIELSQGDRNFNNGLSYLAKAKADYIVSVIEP